MMVTAADLMPRLRTGTMVAEVRQVEIYDVVLRREGLGCRMEQEMEDSPTGSGRMEHFKA